MADETATKGKVLVIDDEPEITDIIDAYMSNAGYNIMVENSSVMGVERAKTFKPDVILLDLMMPYMDGYEVCAEMRKHDTTKNIPVLFLTGKDPSDDAGKVWEVGGNMFVKKPFSCERLLEMVNMVIATLSK
ncbi:MAG: response regulator [candidate division Zixibacteria bacterium]|nr:response regulator [candidate division Zixibacteria bacterium]